MFSDPYFEWHVSPTALGHASIIACLLIYIVAYVLFIRGAKRSEGRE